MRVLHGTGITAHRTVLVGALLAAGLAANAVLAAGVTASPKLAVVAIAVAMLPVLALAFGALVERHRFVLALIALSAPATGLAIFYNPLPLPGGPAVFWSDVVALLALGAWLAAKLSRSAEHGHVERNRLLSLLLVPLMLALVLGIARGHDRYGASLIGQPFRIVLYAAVALAIAMTTAAAAWRAITVVFYGVAVIQGLFAAYFLATGGSQTDQVALSTGGSRVLAGSTGIYLMGSLVCALLNVELDRNARRQALHVLIGLLALFGIVLTFTRATWAAVALVIPLLFLTRPRLRRQVAVLLPLAAPFLAAVALVIPLALPDLYPTLASRIGGTSGEDLNVQWRERASAATLEGFGESPWRGLGFGRETSFVIENQVVELAGDPHNSYVYLLAGGGIVLLGSFALLCIAYLVDTLRRILRSTGREQALATWSLAMFATFALNALAGPIFSDPSMMLATWTVMALPALVSVRRERDEPPAPARTP